MYTLYRSPATFYECLISGDHTSLYYRCPKMFSVWSPGWNFEVAYPTWKLCIHFVYNNCTRCIQLMYTKCLQKFVEMWDTFCIQKFCIHFVQINYDLQKVYIINIMYTVCMQNSYRMYIYTNNCMQTGSLISIYFDLLLVQFLVNNCKQSKLETCWLITECT